MKVLFVCTGNLCRSPMAEALFRDMLRKRGCDAVDTSSVGTWAHMGSSATAEAIAVLMDQGVDLSVHRSRPLERAEAEAADVIVAMTSVHEREIHEVAPAAAHKVLLIKELPGIDISVEADASPSDRLRALLAAERPLRRRALDLDDPIGLPMSAYRRCLGEIERGLRVLADVLCGP